jgi:hypothetical protein
LDTGYRLFVTAWLPPVTIWRLPRHLILFPSDIPAGPTTTHYIGRIVYNVDPKTGVFTLVSTTGQERDICAELA